MYTLGHMVFHFYCPTTAIKRKLLVYSGLLQAYLVPYLRKLPDSLYGDNKNKLPNPASVWTSRFRNVGVACVTFA